MYEDMEPLFANPILPLLAIALADQAFQDYSTFEEIENISSLKDKSLHYLWIKDEMLSIPFFQNITSNRSIRKIHSAVLFSNRTVALGHHMGYQENISIHNIRAEVLIWADSNLFDVKQIKL